MPISLSEAVTALKPNDVWGPPTTTESLVDGVPYAPYSKSDRLGRMADWTTEGKDREARNRQQYNRNYRGRSSHQDAALVAHSVTIQISKCTEPAPLPSLLSNRSMTNRPSPLSTTPRPQVNVSLAEVARNLLEVGAEAPEMPGVDGQIIKMQG